jgi:hypothetical protein
MINPLGRVGVSGTKRGRLSGDSRSPKLTRTYPRKLMITRGKWVGAALIDSALPTARGCDAILERVSDRQ